MLGLQAGQAGQGKQGKQCKPLATTLLLNTCSMMRRRMVCTTGCLEGTRQGPACGSFGDSPTAAIFHHLPHLSGCTCWGHGLGTLSEGPQPLPGLVFIWQTSAGSQVPRLRIKTSSQLEIGGVQGYILIWSRDRVAGKALREALGAPLGAVWATWTAPWTEWGARCCKT